jgi:hypothetical protein
MNVWSSVACRLDATSRDCREAWAANLGDRVSGTQIWIGRSPCARKRSRCARLKRFLRSYSWLDES